MPPPSLAELSGQVSRSYGFLAELDPEEQQVSRALAQDRPLVLRLLAELPGGRLKDRALR